MGAEILHGNIWREIFRNRILKPFAKKVKTCVETFSSKDWLDSSLF